MKLSPPFLPLGAFVCLLGAALTGCAEPTENELHGDEGEISAVSQAIVSASSTPDYLRCTCRDETTGESSEGELCADVSCSSGADMVAACGEICGTRTVSGVACFDEAPRCTQSESALPLAGTLTSTPNVLECTCGDNGSSQAAATQAECASRTAQLSACATLCSGRGAPKASRCVRGTKRLAEVPTPRFGTVTYDPNVGGYVGDRSYSSRNLQISCGCRDGRNDVVCAPSDVSNGTTWSLNANSCSSSSFVRNTCAGVCGSALSVSSSSCSSTSGRYTSVLFGLSYRWNEGNDVCFWGAPKPNLVECTCADRNIRTCADIKASAVASGGERTLLNNELRAHCSPICASFGGYVPNAYIAQETYSSLCTYSNM